MPGARFTDYLVQPHWMWIKNAGHTEPCDVCGDQTYYFLLRGQARIGRFCRVHAPDLPVLDLTPCIDCGAVATYIDQDGKWRCDEHHVTLDGCDNSEVLEGTG